MKVLHIIKGLGLAGAENHLMRLLPGLREAGIDARLLLWVSPKDQAEDILQAAQARQIPIERWIMPRHLDPLFFLRLVHHLRQERPDMVHTHLVHAETYGIPAARLAGVRYVVNSSHNDDPFRRRWFFRPRNWLLWHMTDAGIAISDYLRQFLLDVEGAKPAQLRTIHYGLPPQAPLPKGNLRHELGLAEDTSLIGSVCRLVPQKGLSDALIALSLLPTHIHYALIGEGVLHAQLAAQARDLGLAERVHFLGWRQDVLACMADLDVLVAPSLWEGFGLVFLEAMSQSLSIVATRVSAIPEIILDGETGHLVPPQNPPALAAAIQKALAHPLGEAGRKRLESHFSPQKMIQATLELYKEVAKS